MTAVREVELISGWCCGKTERLEFSLHLLLCSCGLISDPRACVDISYVITGNYVFSSSFSDVRVAARTVNLSNVSDCAGTTLTTEEG